MTKFKPKPANWRETCRAGLPPPYGWRYDHEHGALVEIQSEQITRRLVLRFRQKKMTMRAIATKLNDNGVPSPTSSVKWYHSHVQKIVTVQRKRASEERHAAKIAEAARQLVQTS